MEFATQPYDVSRRDTVTLRSMFETAVYRWLPAKSKIESHFLLYYARVPEGSAEWTTCGRKTAGWLSRIAGRTNGLYWRRLAACPATPK